MANRMNAYAAGSSSDSSDQEEDFGFPSADAGADEFEDYNPRKRRRTGRDAKESAALGVFGSESEDEGRGKRWKSKSLRGKGMVFAKAGEAQDEDDDDDDEDDGVEDEEDDDDAGDVGATAGLRGGLGLGAKPQGQAGLGAQNKPATGLGWQSPARSKSTFSMNAGTPLGRGFVPSSAGTPILSDTVKDEESMPQISRPSAFGTPTSGLQGGRGGGSKAAKGAGINSGSFAARMMAKMGYKEGQGLGKDGSGRSGVIEVQLRPQGVGLGAVKEKSKQEKEEEKRQAKLKGIVLEDSGDEAVKARKARKKALAKSTGSGMSTPKRAAKTRYHTVSEIQQAAPGLEIPDAFTPILDMTGPGKKMLTSSSGLMTPTGAMTPTSGREESEESKENMKIARRAQNDLSAFVEEWKNLQDQKKWVDMKIEEEQLAFERKQIEFAQMKDATVIVRALADAVEKREFDPVLQQLLGLSSLGELGILPQDELSGIAVAAVLPFIRDATEGWQPLEDPKLNNLAPALQKIKDLLGTNSRSALRTNGFVSDRSHSKQSPYETMIYTIWLPKIRTAITNEWDVHEPKPLLTLMEHWDGLLPSFISSQIYEQLIVQKLEKAVSSWNPKKRRSGALPHHWLFPWLQFLADHHHDPKSSHGLVSDVKRKFRIVIDTWDLKDGVIPGLKDWKQVLGDDFQKMVVRHLLPRMGLYLRTHFQVDPQDQEPYLKYLQHIFLWKDFLSPRLLGQVMVEEVFPLWLNILHQWLTSDGVNYEEVGQWFEWWKTVLPSSLNNVAAVESQWQKGLQMINDALDLGVDAKTKLAAPEKEPLASDRISGSSTPAPAPPSAAPPKVAVQDITLKDVLEDWCMRHDLLFVSERKAHGVTGQPLSRITAATNGKGGVLVYIQGDLVFAQKKKDVWGPVDLDTDELVDMAHKR